MWNPRHSLSPDISLVVAQALYFAANAIVVLFTRINISEWVESFGILCPLFFAFVVIGLRWEGVRFHVLAILWHVVLMIGLSLGNIYLAGLAAASV